MHSYDIEELIRSGRKYIALDASVLQYQALYRHPEDCLPGESIHNFIEFFVQRIEILNVKGFTVKVFFDGPGTELREKTSKHRNERKLESQNKWLQSKDAGRPDYRRLIPNFNIHGEYRKLLQALLVKLGIEFQQCLHEADPQMAQYAREHPGQCIVMTIDGDLAFYEDVDMICSVYHKFPGYDFVQSSMWILELKAMPREQKSWSKAERQVIDKMNMEDPVIDTDCFWYHIVNKEHRFFRALVMASIGSDQIG